MATRTQNRDQAQINELLVLPSLEATIDTGGALILTKKYLSGMEAYAASWPGRVTSLVFTTDEPATLIDPAVVDTENTVPGVEIRTTEWELLAERIRGAALVFAGLAGHELTLARMCSKLGVPLVFNSEYTLRTEFQIIESKTRNPIKRMSQKLWALGAHRKRMKALELATSLQCSGTPTYNAYKEKKDDVLLFFDNRVPQERVVSAELVKAKYQGRVNQPVRLAFGGRFVAMKGVMELPLLARELAKRGLEFTLDIVGAGELESRLKQRVSQLGLESIVKIHPPMDFEEEWIPFLTDSVDLFVCCHLQGDPSSTYPEVMSCGLPIAGYENEAIEGIIEFSAGGWISPRSPRELANLIVAHASSNELLTAALAARNFAEEHSFERTYQKRIEHMIRSSKLPA